MRVAFENPRLHISTPRVAPTSSSRPADCAAALIYATAPVFAVNYDARTQRFVLDEHVYLSWGLGKRPWKVDVVPNQGSRLKLGVDSRRQLLEVEPSLVVVCEFRLYLSDDALRLARLPSEVARLPKNSVGSGGPDGCA